MFEFNQIHVEALCCDFGPLNKALLKRLGVYAEACKNSSNILDIPDYKICNCFLNPFRNNHTIKVLLDFTHIFKRLRGQFERTDLILNEETRARFINEYHLSPTDNHCSFHWIRLLYEKEQEQIFQHGAAMTMTNLCHADIWPSSFQRMRVKYTSKLFSNKVASAIMAYRENDISFLNSHSTAIFLIETNNWFKLVNNYKSDLALSTFKPFLLQNLKTKIKNFAKMIVLGKFVKTKFPEDYPQGYKLPNSSIKPIQSSVAISTASLDMIATDLMKLQAINFYTTNTSQDSVESFFSELRAEGFGNPTPLRVLQILKNRIIKFRNSSNKHFTFFGVEDSEDLICNYELNSRY